MTEEDGASPSAAMAGAASTGVMATKCQALAPPLDRPEEPAPKRGVKLKFIFHAEKKPCRRRHGRARVHGRLCVDKSVKEETRIL